MSWTSAGAMILGRSWQMTAPISSEYDLFRFQHTLSAQAPFGFWASAAQIIVRPDGKIELLDFRRLYATEELEIIRFPFPSSLGARRIGVKWKPRYITGISWLVNIDLLV